MSSQGESQSRELPASAKLNVGASGPATKGLRQPARRKKAPLEAVVRTSISVTSTHSFSLFAFFPAGSLDKAVLELPNSTTAAMLRTVSPGRPVR